MLAAQLDVAAAVRGAHCSPRANQRIGAVGGDPSGIGLMIFDAARSQP
jgi:hypothetical protein